MSANLVNQAVMSAQGTVIPLLQGAEDYWQWSQRMWLELWYQKVRWIIEMGCVTEEQFMALPTTSQHGYTKDKWSNGNRRAHSIITNALGTLPFDVAAKTTSAVVLWRNIRERYGRKSSSDYQEMLNDFVTMMRLGDETVEQWGSRLCRVKDELTLGKVTCIDETMLKNRFSFGLGQDWSFLRTHDINTHTSFDSLLKSAMQRERSDLDRQRREKTIGIGSTALVVTSKKRSHAMI